MLAKKCSAVKLAVGSVIRLQNCWCQSILADSTIVLGQFQGLLVGPVIPPGNGGRRRNVLVRVLNVYLLVLFFVVLGALEVSSFVLDEHPRTRFASLLVRRTRRPANVGRGIVTDQLTDHPERAGFPLGLFADRVDPVDPLVPLDRLSGRGISYDGAKRATFSSHSGD